MLDSNTLVSQLIYTAGGTKIAGRDNANFGTYSASADINDEIRREIESYIGKICRGDPETYNPQYRNIRVLKPGAKLHGVFTKKYRDSDYETKKVQISSEIKILSETGKGSILRLVEYSADYIDNPQEAPYRLATTTLSDGRLMVVKQRAINKMYSNADPRSGNYFSHAYIFPKGTKLEDIDINKLQFRSGLKSNEWGKDGQPAPKYLPQLTISNLYQQSQENKSETPNNLIEIYKNSLPTNKDVKSRIANKTLFNKTLSQGTNLLEFRNIIYEQCLNQLSNGQPLSDLQETLKGDLEIMETPHVRLLSMIETLVKTNRNLDIAYENDDTNRIKVLESKVDKLNQEINDSLTKFSKEELEDVITLQEENLKLVAKIEALEKGKKLDEIQLNSTYRLKDDYRAVNKLKLIVTRNTSERKRS